MYDLSTLAAGSILVALILYALLGGADFGGGSVPLCASVAERVAAATLVPDDGVAEGRFASAAVIAGC